MRAWVLGSGVPTPSPRRACSGYLVEIDDELFVLDHGFGAFQRLLDLGVDLARISHLFLTHLHYDHMGDFARLVLTRWDQNAGRIPDIRVFGPPPLARTAEKLFSPEGVFGPDVLARTRDASSLDLYRLRGGAGERARPDPQIQEIAPGDVVEGKGWSVECAEVEHFRPLLTCYAYRVVHAGRSLVYSGDTGPAEALVHLAQDCDVLIHMCHYLSGSQESEAFAASCTGHMEVAEIARACRAKTLVLTHITRQIDRPGVRERVVADIAGIYDGTIILAQDLLQIPFDEPDALHVD